MEIARGDLVTIAIAGDYGKPRPALVVQADSFTALDSVTVLRLTSDLHDTPLLRVTVRPTPENGLRLVSQIMVDKAATVPRTKIRQKIGKADTETLRTVNRALARFLGLA
ncbi:type II toxin-antitoxin system PemK/MazF family toxin [Inquilinus sp. CAU 1745]|uniref:type II toxin-antitoxin system PemK/MazF family toxin n=1 Tax=Inquilinus sp. CAU 1745 TaxID=3140369 RepID=UPI00325BF61B